MIHVSFFLTDKIRFDFNVHRHAAKIASEINKGSQQSHVSKVQNPDDVNVKDICMT